MVARLAAKDASDGATEVMPLTGHLRGAPSEALQSSSGDAISFLSTDRTRSALPEEFQDASISGHGLNARKGRTTSADMEALKDAPAIATITMSTQDHRDVAIAGATEDAPTTASGCPVPSGRYRSADAGAIDGVPQAERRLYSADKATLDAALMGHFARQVWDLQNVRIQMGNRVAAMERDGLGLEWSDIARSINEHTAKAENVAKAQLERIAKKHFMADWVQAQQGIGLYGFALILGSVGGLDRFPTYAKLWRYLGLDVVDGKRVSLKKGVKASFSTRGRMTCYQISASIVRVGKGRWREMYDRKKAEYVETRPDWTPAHRHNAAQRYAVKMLLRAMHREWMRRVAA